MKICVDQNEIICNLRYVRLCDHIHSYTAWLDNGKYCKTIHNKNVYQQIKADKRDVITLYYKMEYNNIYNLFDTLKDINKYIIIISGCSDYKVTLEILKKKPKNIIKWYGENIENPNDSLISLPMGSLSVTWVGNDISHAEIINHPDFTGLIKINNNIKKSKKLAFMCFSLETNYNHRKEVYEYFRNMSWISNLCKFNTNKYLNDEHFITNCYNHDFVICPFGNGIDCGRTWMALQLGSIPILPYHISFVNWAEKLPIILYNDLNEITENYLISKKNEFANKVFTYDYLKTSYWKSKWDEDKKLIK
jgi:hypothetical protein